MRYYDEQLTFLLMPSFSSTDIVDISKILLMTNKFFFVYFKSTLTYRIRMQKKSFQYMMIEKKLFFYKYSKDKNYGKYST